MRTGNATRSHQGLETPLLELELLRAFAEVCAQGSITAAALKLHRSQSAISQQIGKLEHKAGVALLLRNAAGVQPTAEGLTLLEHAKAMLAHNERVFEQLAPGSRSSEV